MDEQQKNDFAARLQRIKAQKGEMAERPMLGDPALDVPNDVEDMLPSPDLPEPRPSRFGVVRVGFILVTLLAIFGYGALYLLEMSEGSVRVAGGPSVPAEPSKPAPSPDESPLLAFAIESNEAEKAERRRTTERGWLHPLGSVATPDGAEVRVGDIAEGFDPAMPDRMPREIVPFPANADCTLRRPAAGEVVRNVRIGHATVETDIHAISDVEMADAILTHTRAVIFKPKSPEFGATANGRLNRVDVFVTDTEGPIYLVLQSFTGNTLWNVHRGQGVRIAHIAMIGNTSGVVAPDGVSFEALRIRDFVTDFEFGSNDEPRPCMIAPYRLPKPFWEAKQKAQKGNTLYSNQMYTFNAGQRAFATWYAATLGTDPEAGLTEADGAGHALVGPLPPARLGYRTLEGRRVHVTEADNLLNGDVAAIMAHRALTIAASGGDVAAINPPIRRIAE